MKIIDLLNMIANGEEVPQFINYYNRTEKKQDCMFVCKENLIYELDKVAIELNDEVEIIEEIIEKAKGIKKIDIWYEYDGTNDKTLTKIMLDELKDKINEIIDKINEMENK